MAKIVMLGTTWCGDCVRSRAYLDGAQIPYDFIDVDEDLAALKVCEDLSGGVRRVPTIVIDGTEVLIEPSDVALAEAIARHP
jgi:thioredoxin reductase (NADPH)